VNAFIEKGNWPVEYKLLGVEPEKFEAINMVEASGYMAFSFAFTLKTEPLIDFVLKNYPDSAYIAGMNITHPAGQTIISNYKENDTILAELSIKIDELMEDLPVPILQGSNSWALAPSKTKSGKVIFCNDTHIKFSQPQSWYESHIEYPGFSFYGNYLAGIPFALIGHNRQIAWGLTMFENDDADLYYETINEDSSKYKFDNKWKDLIVINEEIKIKGEDAQTVTIRETQNGPIITDFLTVDVEQPVSFWWTYNKFPSRLMDVFYLLNNAHNIQMAEHAASLIHAPGLNVNYGDAFGNIAWWASAKMVKRPEGMQAMAIHDGSDPAEQLTEFWNFSDNPHSVNPPQGYIYSCNNQSGMMPDSTYYPGYYAPENRAKRLTEILDSNNEWDVEQVKSISTDVLSVVERDVNMSLCEKVDPSLLDTREHEILNWMKNWSGSHEVSSGEPVLYYRWLQLLMNAVYKDELGESYFKMFASAHRHKRSYPIVFTDSNSPWWDNVNTPEKESAQALCTQSFIEAIAVCGDDWGSDYSKWVWGEAHQLYFEHPLGKVEALSSTFNVGPINAPGGNETLNNAGIDLISTKKVNYAKFGPQMRIIIDFDDVDHSLSVAPSGQSGNFMSPHYSDQAQMFADGKFRKQLMDKEEIVKGKRMVFKAGK
ncbi:MAG: penicillin acylase family protein, partial [Bacteroidetes bacterium]